MARGKVAAMVGVEDLRNATDMPVRLALAPDRLAQREGGVEDGRRLREQIITRDSAAVVILNDRQPGAESAGRPRQLTTHPTACDRLARSRSAGMLRAGGSNQRSPHRLWGRGAPACRSSGYTGSPSLLMMQVSRCIQHSSTQQIE